MIPEESGWMDAPMALTPKARKAALALAVGATQDQAGREAGVDARTVRAWLARGEFRAEVERLTDDLIEGSIRRKVGLLSKADSRLYKLIDSADERVAVRAAKLVYESLISMRNHGEVRAKLEEIQEALRHGDKRGWDSDTEAEDDGHDGTGDGTVPEAPEG
jgi:hypothetical protein